MTAVKVFLNRGSTRLHSPPERVAGAHIAREFALTRRSGTLHYDDGAVVGYAGRDAGLEIRLSSDGNELAIFDLVGRRRPCEARLPADRRIELAAALARMADTAQRSEYSESPTKVLTDGGGRVDVAALPAEVAVYVFRPGAWASRSVHLAPGDARRLADDMQQGYATGDIPSSG
jgi:hypothetical protein